MAASVISFMQAPHGGSYSRQHLSDSGHSTDSHTSGHGYPPPRQFGYLHGYVPPLQPGSDNRCSAYPPEHRSSYYDDRSNPQYSDYPPDCHYRQGDLSLNGYAYDYRGIPLGSRPADAGPGVAQGAPRQRVSIACGYCRRRKIRCSGYQSAPGGKCWNCARKNQACTFQPVSSSSCTAFVPLSAVQGGVPLGTQLLGAYGQPLAPMSIHGGQHSQHGGPSGTGGACYSQPGQSPTNPYAPYDGNPRDDPFMGVRKRKRDAMDRDEDWRRQPPRSVHEDDACRRSPAELFSTGSPGGGNYDYLAPRHNTHAASVSTAGAQSRPPRGQNGSSGASTPVRQLGVPEPQGQHAPTSKMSLSNLVDKMISTRA